ncbi:Do family serine endopeptidase [Hyphomicrobium sp. D-2]|uniref:Do family serine endopeptidase n=1 Tax=Hyphomicrobium sp. D-2 TaxID=3041621 RepID=UPI0024543A98|nr:Do family serine endopeptidase [Hyphomicrobium sp. D-2]MDH4983888.1 Do family serine endopeptidase [Hyphomicrobium sp. D-2]
MNQMAVLGRWSHLVRSGRKRLHGGLAEMLGSHRRRSSSATPSHSFVIGCRKVGAFIFFALTLITSGALFSGSAGAQQRGPQSVAPVAEQLIEAVVNISTSQAIKGPQGLPLPSVPKGSPYHEYFDEFFDNRNGRSAQDRMVSSLGSGFIVDGKEGIIVTNNHVIDGAEEIQVNLHDGSKLKAELLGRDTKTDIAVLKVKPKAPLKAVKFGSSAAIRVGDWVMAIGNPFGLGGSVTLGIISAKARNINSGPYDDYLQTDASINKGNSGGPLFNMDGEVIGVNTAIISPTGGSIGIGFAVPADTVVPVVQQITQFREVRRGWLGVKIQSVSEDIAASLKIPDNVGAVIAALTPGGPAEAAGLMPGDVILRFDNEQVAGMRSLPKLVARTPIDKTVPVEVLRNGERKVLQVTVGRLADESDAAAPSANADGAPATADTELLGMKLAELTDELRKKFELDADIMGAVVTAVDPKSSVPGSIRPGDVIVQAANEPVRSPKDVVRRVQAIKKKGNRSTIMLELEDANGAHRFVSVPLE